MTLPPIAGQKRRMPPRRLLEKGPRKGRNPSARSNSAGSVKSSWSPSPHAASPRVRSRLSGYDVVTQCALPGIAVRILVVDDSRTVRASIVQMVARMGHSAIEAENGAAALEIYRREQVPLVLLDVSMPVMDGYETARAMRSARLDEWIPIIFLSAHEGDQDLQRAIESGGDDYLVKPVCHVVLSAKIRAMQRIDEMRQRLVTVSRDLAAANRELERLSRLD